MAEDIHRYYKIYKPYGYLSQFKYELSNRKSKKTLKHLGDFPEGIMSVGRLDEDSEGLLLVTTDGKFSNDMRQKTVEKEYWVQVDGIITDAAIEELQEGVTITVEKQAYKTLPCKAWKITETPTLPARAKKIRDDRHGPTSWAAIVVTEGKFRQVKKMTAAVGFPTLRLMRYRVGSYTAESMDAGEIIEINPQKKA